MNRKTAIVTGASGFVGSRTLDPLLRLGFEVHGFGRRPSMDQRIHHHSGDLFNRNRVRDVLATVQPTHLLHCAWYTTHNSFWSAPENLDWVGATLSLAREAADAGVLRFVGVGSCAEYSWADDGVHARREVDEITPATLYGAAKAATYQLLNRYFTETNVSFAWARLFHLFGSGEAAGRFVPSILSALREGKPAVCRHGHLVRDYLSVEKAGGALAAIVDCSVGGPINVGSGRSTTLEDFAHELAASLGKEHLLTVEHQTIVREPPRMTADIGRLTSEVHFDPSMKRVF